MHERALAGSFFAIRFLPERPGRKYYSLSTYFRKSGDMEVESTRKGDAMLFAEAFAVLSHPWQAPGLRKGAETDDNCRPASSRRSGKHNGASARRAESNGTTAARKYKSLFRDFPRFTPQCRAKILEALAVCTPVEIACERAGIVKSTYYRWIRIGKALRLGEESPDIPHFLPRQSNEPDAGFQERRYLFDWLCADLDDFFLATMQTRGDALFQLHKRLNDRALNGDV